LATGNPWSTAFASGTVRRPMHKAQSSATRCNSNQTTYSDADAFPIHNTYKHRSGKHVIEMPTNKA
jgi:hypothetical protein